MTCLSKLSYAARRLIRRSSMFTYGLSLILPKRDRPYFWMWYVYLRWVDDFVDTDTHSVAERRIFIDSQLKLIQILYEKRPCPIAEHEQYLAAVIIYDLERARKLERPLHNMLEAIKSELLFAGEVVEHGELDRNYKREVISYLSTLAYFCRTGTHPQQPPGSSAAIGAKHTHVLRDAIPDLLAGRFRISQQDLSSFSISMQTFRDTTNPLSLRRWVATKVREAHALLNAGLLEVSVCQSIRYRLLVAILVSKYQAHLDRLRANHFALKEPAAIPLLWFLQHLVKNVASVMYAGKASTLNAPAAPVGRLLRARTLRRIIPIWILHPWINVRILLHLRNSMHGVSIDHSETRTMRRRFVTAYYLGRESFKFVNASSSARNFSHRAGLVYAYWAVSIIELDRIVDQGSVHVSFVEALCSSWLNAVDCATCQGKPMVDSLRESKKSEHNESHGHIASRFSVLSAEFVRQVTLFHLQVRPDCNHETPAAEFLGEMRYFLASQAMSRDQTIICDAHDWSWYCLKVLNQKTLGFFTAPMSLWTRTQEDRGRSRELIEKFVSLNDGYLHWQLLDDVADVSKDTMDGLVTAPGYILLSQGSLAQAWLNQETGAGHERASIVELLTKSLLLCDWFHNSPLLDSVRQCIGFSSSDAAFENLPVAIHCSLANTSTDLRLSVEELSVRRIEQAGRYAASMKSRNWGEAIRWLNESAAAGRIVFAVNDERRRTDTLMRLGEVADTSLFRVLYILERLIRRAYLKARRAVSWDVPDE